MVPERLFCSFVRVICACIGIQEGEIRTDKTSKSKRKEKHEIDGESE